MESPQFKTIDESVLATHFPPLQGVGSAAVEARPNPSDTIRSHVDEYPPSPLPANNGSYGNSQAEAARPAMEPTETGEVLSEVSSSYPTGFKFVIITTALSLGIFIIGLDNTIVSTAVLSITDELTTIADIGWYSSA